MKDIKHIRRDFHSVAWVMPQGSDISDGIFIPLPWSCPRGGGLRGTVGDQKTFFQIQPDLVCELHEWLMQQHNFLGPRLLGPGGGGGGPKSLKSQLQSQFQRFLN